MKFLIGLQDCDIGLREIAKKKEEGPIKIQKLKEGLSEIENQLEDESNQIETYKRERRQAEQEIEDLESRIEKSNIKLSNIKSNKEYQAALKEIADLKEGKFLLEDKAIEIMEKIEEIQEQYEATKVKGKKLGEQFEKDRDEILKELEILDQDLAGLESERARFCRSVDENLLKKYDYLGKNKGGLAISSVIKGVCQTCHMGIPPQKFNELIRGDELMTCPSCMRIIYWGEDERFQKIMEKG